MARKKPGSTDFMYKPAPRTKQTQIFYDSLSYSAFPHVVQLEGDELLIAFRQAPRQKGIVRHTHPRSVITVMRSYDQGDSWDKEGAAQVAAGGGQELGLIYLGNGKVGGALAAHEVVPVNEGRRSGLRQTHAIEYPFGCVGGLWCWSDNHGLTWRVENTVLFADGSQCCAPPVQLSDGTLLIPVYGNFSGDDSSAILYRSTDGGASWSMLAVMGKFTPKTRGYAEPAVLELSPGHLLGLHRVGEPKFPPGTFWRNESFDSGKTWSAPKPISVRSGACPRLLKLHDGRLLLTYGRRFEPFGIYASLSSDDGQSWGETSWLLRKTPDSDQGYSSSVELADGRIFTACYAKNSRGITGITGTFWHLPPA